MVIHSTPYTNLVVALFVLAVLVTWFGEKVAWDNLDISIKLISVNRFFVVVQTVSSIMKLFQVIRLTSHGSPLYLTKKNPHLVWANE